MNNKRKPQFLYRGIKVNYELLKSFEFCDGDIYPPNKPKINQNGIETAGDGNEYGVYMTDHDIVARNAYAAVKQSDGIALNRKKIVFGLEKESVRIPSVGVVYKINTDGLDIHIPWIVSHLKGHYNNGMGGDEWITDSIPSSNYSIDTIQIGPDILHESEMVEVENTDQIREKILKKIEFRIERLELFEKRIESMSEKERYLIESSKINILKEIYKLNGLMDVNLQSFEPNNVSDYLKYLKTKIYNEDTLNINFSSLGYLQSIELKVLKIEDTKELIEFMESEIIHNNNKKNEFISRKQTEGNEFSTKYFDEKHKMYEKIKKYIEVKMNEKTKKKQLDNSCKRIYTSQIDSQIENSNNYINYTEFKRTDNEKKYIEKNKSPLINNEKQVIGEVEDIDEYEYETGINTRTRYETIESENGVFSVDTKIINNGENSVINSKMQIFNEISKCKETAEYTLDETGKETYCYMENGIIGQKIIKTNRGTTIDIFKDGQPYSTFEYDENGKALIPMGKMEQLPENYIEKCFKETLPEYSELSMPIIETQELGKQTIDINNNTEKIDNVNKQMDRDLENYKQEILSGLDEELKGFDEKDSKKDTYKVEKNDDDYVR